MAWSFDLPQTYATIGVMQLVLNYKFPSLNDLIGKASYNRFAYAAEKKKLTQYVADECLIQGLKRVSGPIAVRFQWQEATKRRDFDNVSGAGQKLILDGLKLAGVIEDDRQKYVRYLSHTFSHGKTNRVIVTLDGVPAETAGIDTLELPSVDSPLD